MIFEVGDKIKLLHSGEEGLVIAILGKDLLQVNVGGVVFPVAEEQVEFLFRTIKKKPKRQKLEGEKIPLEKKNKKGRTRGKRRFFCAASGLSGRR